MLDFDTRDESEQLYTAKFLVLSAKHGIGIRYALDRGALDLGLHLTMPINPKKKGVTAKRIWFQFKGIDSGANGISKEKFDKITEIPLGGIKIEHLRQWYRYAEPVYLTVYLEALDKFFAVDIQRLIDERWGASVFRDETFKTDKGVVPETTTIYLPKTSEVNESFWDNVSEHSSMRIDGATFQGRPLVDLSDIQSDIPQIMSPELFEDVVGQLLTIHKYRMRGVARDPSFIYPKANISQDVISVSIGKLFQPFQFDLYLTRELLPDEDGYREDGQTFRIQGDCAVIIHSSVKTQPDPATLKEFAQLLESNGINNVLVFINHYMTGVAGFNGQKAFNSFPVYSQGFSGSSINWHTLHLEDLGKTILLTTNVYLNFREDIHWLNEALEEKIKTGELRIMEPEEYFRGLEKMKLK